MSTYEERLEQLRRGHGAADRADPNGGERWRTVRYLAALELLADAAGVALVDLDRQLTADAAEEVRVVRWAAETLDGPTVAALAALLDRARTGAEVDA